MGKHLKAKFDGEKLKAVIKEKGLTQRQVAEMTGISIGGLSHIVSCAKVPSVTLNKVICLTLGVAEDTFLIKPEPPKPELLAEEVAVDSTAVTAVNEATDKLLVYLERMERKQDRLEMLMRSVQNENLKLHQEILKLKAK